MDGDGLLLLDLCTHVMCSLVKCKSFAYYVATLHNMITIGDSSYKHLERSMHHAHTVIY